MRPGQRHVRQGQPERSGVEPRIEPADRLDRREVDGGRAGVLLEIERHRATRPPRSTVALAGVDPEVDVDRRGVRDRDLPRVARPERRRRAPPLPGCDRTVSEASVESMVGPWPSASLPATCQALPGATPTVIWPQSSCRSTEPGPRTSRRATGTRRSRCPTRRTRSRSTRTRRSAGRRPSARRLPRR